MESTKSAPVCPLTTVREALHLSRLALAQLAGVAATRISDCESGRTTRIPGAVIRALQEYVDVQELERLFQAWFDGLGQEVRDRAEEYARLSAPYGGNSDGGGDDHNLSVRWDTASIRRK